MKNKKNVTVASNSTLGGTSTDATAAAPAPAATPGRAARTAAKAGKREYTARGTTYWARRVVLAGGKPVGRGKPAKEGRGQRMVVYIPVGMEYDAAVHGPGVKYNTASHRATHKRIRKDSVSYTFDDGVTPAKAKAKAKAKDKGRGKATKAKAKAKTAPSVPVAAVDTGAPIDNAPVAAPVAAVDTGAPIDNAPVAAPATA